MINLGKGRLRVARQPAPPPVQLDEAPRMCATRVPQPAGATQAPEPLNPELAALRVEFDAGRLTEREYLSRRAALLRVDAGQRTL